MLTGHSLIVDRFIEHLIQTAGWLGCALCADVTPDEYCESVAEWLALQEESKRAFVVGGCCGIFPEHIEKVREVLDAASSPPAS